MTKQTRHRRDRPTDGRSASTDDADRPHAGTPRHLPSGVAFVLALGVVLATIAVVPALSPVGTASAVQCADDEVAVEILLLNDGLGTTPPSDIYYTITKNEGAYDGIVENGDLEELGSSPYLIVDLSESQAGAIHKLTACYTEGLPHEVQLELEDGSELVFSPGIEDELIFDVEGGVQAGTIEKNYINTNHIGVQFQTTLSCSADERKIELEFGGGGGTYTAFVDGTEIRVEDNSLENGVTETRQMCFDYGDSYTVEQKGDYTDHGTLPDPEIMDVSYYDSNGNYVSLGSNEDISIYNPNARVTFTLNRRPTADATKGRDAFGGETSIVEGQTEIAFDGTDSSDPDGNALSYEWAFGDGTTATGATTTYNYTDAVSIRGGNTTYSPDLTVDDGLGKKSVDTDSDFATITVYNDLDGDGRADSDAAPGQADPDDDGDGIPDSIEENSTTTTDLPAGATTVTVEGTVYPDSDGDGNADLWDLDSDDDGISDSVEGTTDGDGDGTADYRDVDSDDDGIPDSVEGTTDADGDGAPNYRDADSDNDGVPDSAEATTDTDSDGTPDYLDTDSDGDGVPDRIEGTGTGSPVDSITVSLGDSSLRTGGSTTLTAVATFANANEFNVTALATLASNDTDVVTVDANGTVSAVESGQTRVNATFQGVNGTGEVSVSTPSRRSSSGGGGGSSDTAVTEPRLTTTATETETGTETEITVQDTVAGEPVTVQRGDGEPLARSESTSVDSLTITSETDRDFSARVSTSETLDETNPDGVVDLSPDRDGSAPVGYLTIDHNLDDEVTEATISFSVRSDRVGESEVQLYRNVEGSWNPLETRFVNEADGVANYEAITPGFSTFAIGVRETTETAADVAPAESQPTPQPTESDTPGFGIVVGLVALLGVALLLARRDSHPTDD